MLDLLKELRKKVVIGFVGGSDLTKISEQLAPDGKPGACPSMHTENIGCLTA
jgi:hypothetical protein